MLLSTTWLSPDERPPPAPRDGKALTVQCLLSDGREALGRSEREGIRLLGRRGSQMSFDDLATITGWRPIDEQQLEDFENG
jgi:hypothetical protein